MRAWPTLLILIVYFMRDYSICTLDRCLKMFAIQRQAREDEANSIHT